MQDRDIRFVDSDVEVLAQTNLRDAENHLQWRVQGQLAVNRFLDRWAQALARRQSSDEPTPCN